MRNDFSVIVDYFEKLSLFAAGVDRLSSFIRRVNRGGWESEVQDPQPQQSMVSSVVAIYIGQTLDIMTQSVNNDE